MHPILRKARIFLRLPLIEQIYFLPAWILLGLSRLAILTVSFRRLAPRLGVSWGASAWVPLLSKRDEKHAAHVGRTVRLAARYTPWESNCFPQAVTARLLLGTRGIAYAMYFGLARDGEGGRQEMKAHAWIAAGRVSVTGGRSFGTYTVVGCFVAPDLARDLPGRIAY